MILNDAYALVDGVDIPRLGLGTWMVDDAVAAQAVRDAVELGYRHIDSAQAYMNERGVGEGVRTCGVPREELFIATKMAAEIKDYDGAVAGITASLEALQMDYIDLMLIHSPKPWMEFQTDEHYFEGNREVWRAMEEAYAAGTIRAIGVSNFEQVDLDNILDACTVRPMVNQILVHISNTPHDLIAYTQEQGILVEAYSPIAHGELLKNEQVAAMAERYGVSIPQLSIRYTLQLGAVSLPKTSNPDHMRVNADVDFVIADEDMEILKNVDQIEHYGDASFMPVFGGDLRDMPGA